MKKMIETIDIKQARTRYNVLDVIRKRWSPRSFREDALLPEELNTLIEAAMWAPSAMNEQPWRFALASKEDEAAFNKLASFLYPGNAVWAGNAAALVVVMAVTTFEKNGQNNGSASHDVGMATMNLLIQASGMDIYGHVMGGFDREKAKTELNLPDNIVPVTMIALGRLDEAERLEEPFLSRERSPRTRKSLEELIFPVSEM